MALFPRWRGNRLKVDNTLTYLQTAFDPLRYPQQILQMEQHFAGEVISLRRSGVV
jgi:hypothetical protein